MRPLILSTLFPLLCVSCSDKNSEAASNPSSVEQNRPDVTGTWECIHCNGDSSKIGFRVTLNENNEVINTDKASPGSPSKGYWHILRHDSGHYMIGLEQTSIDAESVTYKPILDHFDMLFGVSIDSEIMTWTALSRKDVERAEISDTILYKYKKIN